MRLKRKEKKQILFNQQDKMQKINPFYFIIIIFIAILLSIFAIALNHYVIQYKGNAYLNLDNLTWILTSILMYLGTYLLFGKHTITRYVKEFLYFFLILNLILLMTYAVQFTPFQPIDIHLAKLDKYSHIQLVSLLSWTNQQDMIRKILTFIYGTISKQLIFIPLLLIICRRFEHVHEYYFLTVTTLLIGYVFYYFFPTTAPASILDSPYFMEHQKATGLKFYQIHQYLEPTTWDGGLISLPSYHVIWAYLCLYVVRIWPIISWALFPVNLLIAVSCVFLGWHYPIDLLGSAIVIIMAHFVHRMTMIRSKKVLDGK